MSSRSFLQGEATMEDIAVGDSVMVWYNGYPEVPKWMSGMTATVKAKKRTRIVIHHISGVPNHEMPVRLDHIRKVMMHR